MLMNAPGGYWVVEAQPRQWMLRKPSRQTEAREELKAEILAAEMGHLVARPCRKLLYMWLGISW